MEAKKLNLTWNKKTLTIAGAALLAVILIIVILTSSGGATPKNSGTPKLNKAGNSYKLTVEEYCDRFNAIANRSWCNGSDEELRLMTESQIRASLEAAAQYDASIWNTLTQTMTREMIPGLTLMLNEDTGDITNGEKYVRYTYTNQYSFIPDRISVEILAEKETDYVKIITVKFPMDYRYIGDKFGQLVCETFQNGDLGFQDLYIRMKEAGGYGHMYQGTTVFQLSYDEGSDTRAFFMMSACTPEHYEEEWANNPDLPSKENPIVEEPEEDYEEYPEYDYEEYPEDNDDYYYEEMAEDMEMEIPSGMSQEIVDLVTHFEGYTGTWDEFVSSVGTYDTLLSTFIQDSVTIESVFTVEEGISVDISNFQWDGIHVGQASCFLELVGMSASDGSEIAIQGAISISDFGELIFQEMSY